MRINSINRIPNYNNTITRNRTLQRTDSKAVSPSFCSWTREVYEVTNGVFRKLKHRNDTCFFRGGSEWTDMVKFLSEKYADIPKVNVYNWGCSNGSEAYTFIMALLTNLKKEVASKFMPIFALDYDEVAIEYANLNELVIDDDEVDAINQNTNNSFDRFFSMSKPNRVMKQNWYTPDTELSDNVFFKMYDIKKDYKKMRRTDSVVFARNFWPYLSYKEKIKLAQDLYNHLGENCTLIIGNYDNKGWDAPTTTILKDAGFKSTGTKNIFVK